MAQRREYQSQKSCKYFEAFLACRFYLTAVNRKCVLTGVLLQKFAWFKGTSVQAVVAKNPTCQPISRVIFFRCPYDDKELRDNG